MSLNLSLMESGLADRVQPQTHFMSTLPPRPTCPAHTAPSTQGSPEAALTGCFCCFRTIFGKTLRLNLFASLLLTVYCRAFFPTNSEGD